MKKLLCLAFAAPFLLPLGNALAKVEKKALTVENAYIFQPLQGSNATAGYGTFKNSSAKEVTLAILRADGFKAVEMHETVSEGGMMKMQKVDQFKIAKGASLELKPGGNHIMLFDATKDHKENETVLVTFKNGSEEIQLPFQIKKRDVSPHAHH